MLKIDNLCWKTLAIFIFYEIVRVNDLHMTPTKLNVNLTFQVKDLQYIVIYS